METLVNTTNHVNQVAIRVTDIFSNQFREELVYHDITYVHRILEAINEIGSAENLSEEEMEVLQLAGWLNHVGFLQLDDFEIDDPRSLFIQCKDASLLIAKDILTESGLSSEIIEKVLDTIRHATADADPKTQPHLSKILSDAITIDWAKPKARKRLKKLYEEFLLTGALSVSRKGWYDGVLEYMYHHKYRSDYGQKQFEPLKDKLIQKLEKEKKELEKSDERLLQRELEISADEYKKLKKSFNAVKGRDDRGIQTMFRTTSRNHYTLNQMNDRKANIMISINAILISLILGRVIGQQLDTFCIHNSPILIMLVGAVSSIVLAILAITPAKTHGRFTANDIRDKKGNLLYFGNYHSMNFKDFEWGMHEMLNDGNYLYSMMIQDLYFLGQTLQKKSMMIRASLTVFMLAFAISVITFLIVSGMEDYHFGNPTH